MLDAENIKTNVDSVDKELRARNNRAIDFPHANISKDFWKDAGEMFIYLNLCSKMKDWTTVYVKLFENNSLDIILQTLNRLMKKARSLGDNTLLKITKKMIVRVANKFSLKFSIVDQLTKGNHNPKVPNNSNLDRGKIYS